MPEACGSFRVTALSDRNQPSVPGGSIPTGTAVLCGSEELHSGQERSSLFPDAPTARGRRHLLEMIEALK